MDINPYSAPKAVVDIGDAKVLEIEPAGAWRRFFNLLIDYVGLIATSAVLIFMYSLIAAFLGRGDLVADLERESALRDYGLGFLAAFFYYVPLEGVFGVTLGKLITGTRVVNERGERPSWGQVFGRTLCRFIPFEAFSMFGDVSRGWHDSVPRTWVVRRRPR